MTKNTKPRSASQLARDRREIAKMYLQGRLQVEIAEELGLDQSTVSRDLKALYQEWLASALVDFNEAKALEIQKINNLEIIYYQAWERSLEAFKSKVIKAKGNPRTEDELKTSAEQTLKTEDRNGDPRYLQGVQWCIEQRCKILGIYAAVQQEISGKGGGPIIFKEVVVELPPDDTMAD